MARADVARALAEDVGEGDLTAALVDASVTARARDLGAGIGGDLWCALGRGSGAGLRPCGANSPGTWPKGQRCEADQVMVEFEGNAQALLTAERTALNFMQMMSAVATKTALFVAAVAGTKAHIVDTRKTLPGLRLAQKVRREGRRGREPPHRPVRRGVDQGKPHRRCGRCACGAQARGRNRASGPFCRDRGGNTGPA